MRYKGRALEGFDAVIPRIGASVTFYGLAVLRQFEMMGVYPLNESVAIGRSRDKLRCLQLLSRKGIGLPVTAFAHATINGQPATTAITDTAWLQGPFCETVGKRGAAIIAARGLSSAASAANALVDHVRSLVTPGAVHSIAVKSEGRYGFDANVWAGMPVRTTTPGSYEVITDYVMDDFARAKIAATNKELAEERAFVAEMIQ